MKRSIALDISSTHIGWALMEGSMRRFSATEELVGKIDQRSAQAYRFVTKLLQNTWPNCRYFAVESPAIRYAKGAIPQLYVAGAVRLVASLCGLPIIEVAPKEAKKALTGTGNADKKQMLRAAVPILGMGRDHKEFVFQQGKRFRKPSASGDWRAWAEPGVVIYDEHEADALGVGLAASTNLTLLSSVVH